MADATSPTTRQLVVLRRIAEERRRRGHAPTIRELGDALGIRSTNGVADHLRALKRRGLVTWAPSKGRTLDVTPAGRFWLRGPDAEAA